MIYFKMCIYNKSLYKGIIFIFTLYMDYNISLKTLVKSLTDYLYEYVPLW